MSSGPQGGPGVPGAPISTGGRLTEDEQKWVAKLLSDPTYFPIEFRTWLKNFLEQEGGGGGGAGGVGENVATGLPAGIILPVAASTIPVDTLVCDGAPKLRADFITLFGVIGVLWGAGDATTTFNLPDLRDRTLYGVGGKIGLAQTDLVPFGSRGGPEHKHSFAQSTNAGGVHGHSVSGSTDTKGNHDHTPPGGSFLVGSLVQTVPAGGSTFYSPQNVHGRTAAAGDHFHAIGGTAADAGSHSHSVSGDTSGGSAYNRGSFAGVVYVITTGV